MRCPIAVADESVVETTCLRGRGNSGIYRSPIHADLYEIDQAEIHKSNVPSLLCEMRDGSAKPEVYALVLVPLFSLRFLNFSQKAS
jgi:hypothetical protein